MSTISRTNAFLQLDFRMVFSISEWSTSAAQARWIVF